MALISADSGIQIQISKKLKIKRGSRPQKGSKVAVWYRHIIDIDLAYLCNFAAGPDYFNLNLDSIVTPLNTAVLEQLLQQSNYDESETAFLMDGFTNGFDIGYTGPENCQSRSENIPLTLGSHSDLWQKIMKEVKAERVTGLFNEVPFANFMQSPIGLVPKAGGKTRMIFHLSFDFDKDKELSLNAYTPKEWCSMKYNNLDAAVMYCLELVKQFKRTVW